MAETIAQIARGLNAVRTVAQAKIAIGEALSALGAAYQLVGLTQSERRALDAARRPLEEWWSGIANVPDTTHGAPTPYTLGTRRSLIERAYVEIAGVHGVVSAKRTVRLANELAQSTKDLARGAGEFVGSVAGGVGDVAGSLVGGLLSGLGPLVLMVLAVAIFFTWKAKAR